MSLLVSVKQAKCKSTFFLPVFQVACCVLASQPSSASTTLKRPSEWRAWYLREWSSPPGITTDYIQVCRCIVLVIYASSIIWPTGQMSCSHINKTFFFVYFPLEIPRSAAEKQQIIAETHRCWRWGCSRAIYGRWLLVLQWHPGIIASFYIIGRVVRS